MTLEVSSSVETTPQDTAKTSGVKIWFSAGKSKFQLPTAPESISVGEEGAFGTYTILDKGEVKKPYGTTPAEITISGMLFQKNDSAHPLVQAYKDPKTIISEWQKYKNKKSRVKISWSGIPIKLNSYFYVSALSTTLDGVQIKYDLKLVNARELSVTAKKRKKKKKRKGKGKGKAGKNAHSRTSVTTSVSKYRVKSGDSLWSISQKYLGKIHGGWQAIAKLNNIKPPYTIHPGQIIKLPKSKSVK